MAIDQMVKPNGFLGSESYGVEMAKAQASMMHESLATEPSKLVADLMTAAVMVYISF